MQGWGLLEFLVITGLPLGLFSSAGTIVFGLGEPVGIKKNSIRIGPRIGL